MSRSFLDPGQVLQHAFDDEKQAIRVDAEISANISGAQEIIISETDDSILIYGNDGTTNRKLKTNSSGELQIDVLTLPLPSDASTESTLSDLNSKVTEVDTGNISGSVSISSLPLPTGASTEVTLSSLNSKVTTVNTGAVVISSSALPGGAATSSKQDTGNTSLSSIDTKLTDGTQQTKISNLLVPYPFDYISVAYPTTSSEVYTYRSGGSGGSIVATVTVIYTDDTKEVLDTVERT